MNSRRWYLLVGSGVLSALLLAAPSLPAQESGSPEYHLMLISLSDKHRNAVIDRQLVREGDVLPDGAVVESIRPESVLIRRSGEFIEVGLDPERGRAAWPPVPAVERERPETTDERLRRMQSELIDSMSVVQGLLDSAASEITRESAQEEITRRLETLQPEVGEVNENE